MENGSDIVGSPVLFIFSGLPATGKTTLSRELASRLSAVHLRIDTIEQALRDLCGIEVEGQGYRMAYRIAADNLGLGTNVVADSCNPITLTRREWEQAASIQNAEFINIEVICSDVVEHRRRVETRKTSVPGLQLPRWEDVEGREYHEWDTARIIVDTAGRSPEQACSDLWALLPATVTVADGMLRSHPRCQ